jgi:hypothetical protein
MRASIVIAATAVVIVAAGAGYYALEVYPQQRFRADLDQALQQFSLCRMSDFLTSSLG